MPLRNKPLLVSTTLCRNIAHFHFRNIGMENIRPLRCQRTFIWNVEQLKEVRIVRMSSSLRYCMCAVVWICKRLWRFKPSFVQKYLQESAYNSCTFLVPRCSKRREFAHVNRHVFSHKPEENGKPQRSGGGWGPSRQLGQRKWVSWKIENRVCTTINPYKITLTARTSEWITWQASKREGSMFCQQKLKII